MPARPNPPPLSNRRNRQRIQRRPHPHPRYVRAGRETPWRNRLIWGDKKYVLPSLLPEFAGKVNLIYIDPPFDTGANFSFTAQIPDDPETPGDQSATFTKEPSVIEQKAYRDTWGRGLDSYLKWFYETAVLLRELLADNGSIYVHLDYHVSSYARVVLDEVFGNDNFVNEITWKRTNVHSHAMQGTTHFSRIQDSIFIYGKSDKRTWHQLYMKHSDEHADKSYKTVEQGTGRRYSLGDLTATDGGAKGNPRFEFLGVTRYWRYNKEKMERLAAEGRVVQASPGAVPRQKRYLDESLGTEVSSLWTDVPPVAAQSDERVGYATQKPEALLERIIKASSNPGDLVLDCFCGSGTTAAVSEKLNRRWITCDLGRFAIHTARKRLLSIEGVRPFIVQNLGKYERQTWQTAEFGDQLQTQAQREQTYRRFILDLYRARPLEGHIYLHGVKAGRRVHVGAVDGPVTTADITQIALELKRTMGTGADAPTSLGVDILGWDFAFELNEVGKQTALDAGVDVRFVRIPREVLEKKAVEQGDIRFFELAALSVDVKPGPKRAVSLSLTDFVIPGDDVPEEIQRAITHWSQWVDYWAVDWDNQGDAFHNEDQFYRTKKQRDLQRTLTHSYTESGTYRIVVKVIDILGNDTTKTVAVTIT